MNDINVKLMDYTGSGHHNPAEYATNLLIFTKNTRLTMGEDSMEDIKAWHSDKKQAELQYMAGTIPSSWEFIDYTFMISNVTRAFTHQFVRTRTASYAQQTMRVLNVSDGPGWDYATGPTISDDISANDDLSTKQIYDDTMKFIAETYKDLIAAGARVEDARGILPTNIKTNICAKMNMRTFVEMARKRSGPRTQGEYRTVLEMMTAEVLRVHPFVQYFIDRDADRAAKDLDNEISEIEDNDKKIRMMKLVDQMRRG